MRIPAFLCVIAIILTGCAPSPEKQTDSSSYPDEVAEAVELLRRQLVDPEQEVLQNLSAGVLTYGHSSGYVEDRTEFIESLVSGKYNFETLELSQQTIDISGETAIVRHVLSGTTHDRDKEPGVVNLKVLQVWQKDGADWKLLSRQAVKIVVPE